MLLNALLEVGMSVRRTRARLNSRVVGGGVVAVRRMDGSSGLFGLFGLFCLLGLLVLLLLLLLLLFGVFFLEGRDHGAQWGSGHSLPLTLRRRRRRNTRGQYRCRIHHGCRTYDGHLRH